MTFKITIERTSDNKRFTRSIEAASPKDATTKAYNMLRCETDDFYVVSVEEF